MLTAAASCSVLQLAYNNLGWLITYYAGNLLDLDAEQKTRFRAETDTALAIHRREGMPDVVASIVVAERYLADGLDAAEVTELQTLASTLYDDIAARALPLAVNVLLTLTPAQIDHLRAEVAKRNEAFAERQGLTKSRKTRIELRAERMAERLGFWVDELRPAQYRLLDELAAEVPDFVDEWQAYRTTQQAKFFRLMEAPAKPALSAQLTEWWIEQKGLGEASYLRSAEARAAFRRVLLKLDASFDDTQRQHLLWRMRSIREDLESTMREES